MPIKEVGIRMERPMRQTGLHKKWRTSGGKRALKSKADAFLGIWSRNNDTTSKMAKLEEMSRKKKRQLGSTGDKTRLGQNSTEGVRWFISMEE